MKAKISVYQKPFQSCFISSHSPVKLLCRVLASHETFWSNGECIWTVLMESHIQSQSTPRKSNRPVTEFFLNTVTQTDRNRTNWVLPAIKLIIDYFDKRFSHGSNQEDKTSPGNIEGLIKKLIIDSFNCCPTGEGR